jgi:hypothetical protein
MSQVKLSTADQVANFKSNCARLGWGYSTRFQVVTVEKYFTPGDKAAYISCDSESYELLSLVPLKGGSIWGTDGGSVGGYVGLQGGYYRLNKSGTGARFLKALGNS